MSRLCCLEGASAVVRRPGGLRPTASENRTDTASHHLHVLAPSVLMVVGDEVEEVEVDRDSGTRTGAIVRGATRQVEVLLGDAGARAMIVEVRAGVRHRGGESAITVLPEVAAVDEGVARAIQMLATGAIAVIAAVAAVGTVVDVGGSAKHVQVS